MGLSDQVTELRTAFDTVQTELAAAADRVTARLTAHAEKVADLEAKLVAAGEPDPDLSGDVQEIMGEVEKIKAIAPEAAPQPTPEEPPVEPSPVEP